MTIWGFCFLGGGGQINKILACGLYINWKTLPWPFFASFCFFCRAWVSGKKTLLTPKFSDLVSSKSISVKSVEISPHRHPQWLQSQALICFVQNRNNTNRSALCFMTKNETNKTNTKQQISCLFACSIFATNKNC